MLNIATNLQNYITITIIGSLLGYIYHVYFVTSFGGTLGKKILNIRVCDNNGVNLSVLRSIRRYLPYIISDVLIKSISIFLVSYFAVDWSLNSPILVNKILQSNPFYLILNFVMIVWIIAEIVSLLTDSEDKTIHDKIACSLVVENTPNSTSKEL